MMMMSQAPGPATAAPPIWVARPIVPVWWKRPSYDSSRSMSEWAGRPYPSSVSLSGWPSCFGRYKPCQFGTMVWINFVMPANVLDSHSDTLAAACLISPANRLLVPSGYLPLPDFTWLLCTWLYLTLLDFSWLLVPDFAWLSCTWLYLTLPDFLVPDFIRRFELSLTLNFCIFRCTWPYLTFFQYLVRPPDFTTKFAIFFF